VSDACPFAISSALKPSGRRPSVEPAREGMRSMDLHSRGEGDAPSGPPRHPRAIGGRGARLALACAIIFGLGVPQAHAQQAPALPSPDPAPTPEPAAPPPPTATVSSPSQKPAPTAKRKQQRPKRPPATAPRLHPPDPRGAPALDQAPLPRRPLGSLDDRGPVSPTSSSRADRTGIPPLLLALLGLAFALFAVAALPRSALTYFSNALVMRRHEVAYAGLAVLGGVAIGVLIGLSSS
jgi:hypothetical protein